MKNSQHKKVLRFTGLDLLHIREHEDGDCTLQICVERSFGVIERKSSIKLSKRNLAGLAFEILMELIETSDHAREAAYHAGRLNTELRELDEAETEAQQKSEEITS